MAAPFLKRIAADKRKLLDPLFALPVTAAVTTNYDRVLHDGFSKTHDETPVPLELDDHTLKNGALRTEFFVARIHGRAGRANFTAGGCGLFANQAREAGDPGRETQALWDSRHSPPDTWTAGRISRSSRTACPPHIRPAGSH
jgi:hypothetical protein